MSLIKRPDFDSKLKDTWFSSDVFKAEKIRKKHDIRSSVISISEYDIFSCSRFPLFVLVTQLLARSNKAILTQRSLMNYTCFGHYPSYLFPTCRRFLTHLQLTTFENIVAKRRNSSLNEQFLLLPQCFQLYLMIILSFSKISHLLAQMLSMSSASDLMCVGEVSSW